MLVDLLDLNFWSYNGYHSQKCSGLSSNALISQVLFPVHGNLFSKLHSCFDFFFFCHCYVSTALRFECKSKVHFINRVFIMSMAAYVLMVSFQVNVNLSCCV